MVVLDIALKYVVTSYIIRIRHSFKTSQPPCHQFILTIRSVACDVQINASYMLVIYVIYISHSCNITKVEHTAPGDTVCLDELILKYYLDLLNTSSTYKLQVYGILFH